MFLRMILVNTFNEEEDCLLLMYIIGWISPVGIILPYIIFRINYENENCWMDPGILIYQKFAWSKQTLLIGYSMVFLSAPVSVVILFNIFFLVSVIRVLKAKLQFQSIVGSIGSRSSGGSITGKICTIMKLKL